MFQMLESKYKYCFSSCVTLKLNLNNITHVQLYRLPAYPITFMGEKKVHRANFIVCEGNG